MCEVIRCRHCGVVDDYAVCDACEERITNKALDEIEQLCPAQRSEAPQSCMTYTVELTPTELATLLSCLDETVGTLTRVVTRWPEAEPLIDNARALRVKLEKVGRTGNPEIPY